MDKMGKNIELTVGYLQVMGVPPRYWHAKFAALYDEQIEAMEGVIDEMEQDITDCRGYYLYGPNGAGKSYLASMLLKCGLMTYDHRAHWITPDRIKEAFVDRTNLWDDTANISMYKRIHDVPHLIIDDIGKEYRGMSGYVQTVLRLLIRYRYDYLRPTTITSNMTPKEFSEIYGETLGSLFGGYLRPIEVKLADTRKLKKGA